MKKRIVCFILTLVLCAFALPMSAFAEVMPASDCLCFTSESNCSTFSVGKVGNPGNVSLFYSFDGENWTALPIDVSVAINRAGDRVYVKGDGIDPNTSFSKDEYNYYFFEMSGKISAGGSVQSLIGGRSNVPAYAFCGLFRDCTALVNAPNLPSTLLGANCYREMFMGCTGLTTAPDLPATNLANRCYKDMFRGCNKLVNAPKISASVLAEDCCTNMFNGCKALEKAPVLSATTLAAGCYESMFRDCIGLKEAPELPATTLAYACYFEMFCGCTNLKAAPKLPAETLDDSCYERMFCGCKGLENAPKLPAKTLAESCYEQMFLDCTGLTGAPEISATQLATRCCAEMFKNCTGLTKAPVLSATVLAEYCYEGMFYGCTSLKKVPELPATTLADFCYQGMFFECTGINLSKTKSDKCECVCEFRIPKEGTTGGSITPGIVDYMFAGTSGVQSVELEKTYYFNFEKHDLALVKGKAATCEKDGFNDYWQCEQCGECFADKDGETPIEDIAAWKAGEGKIPAAHSFTTKASDKLASAATCTAPAKYYVQCDNCDVVSDTTTVEVGKALGHSFTTKASDKLASAATCTAPAKYYAQCDRCTAISDTKTVAVGEPLSFSFTDVQKGHWSYDDIRFVFENELMNGTSPTKFSPTMPTSRAMIVTVLYRMEGEPTVSGKVPFNDVKANEWYTAGVLWAASEGIVKGYSDTKFGPDDSVTREQLALILYRYAEYKGDDVSARANLNKFSDGAKVSSWAQKELSWANAIGLINGTDKKELLPQGVASREQVAAILHRFMVN